MRRLVLSLVLLACYLGVIIPFTGYMKNRPFIEKLGYTPQAEVLKAVAADQKEFVAAALVMKALFYYGSLVENNLSNKIKASPDYYTLYRTVETSVKLDPYNMDSYYFGQAIMSWDVGRVKEANALLEYGMKFRTWDFYLPFFAAFNYAYFLKDYQNAARCYKKAAELSGDPLYASLAGRYLYESGQTDLALGYLTAMEKSARNQSIRKSFQVRIAAFREVRRIEGALAQYKKDKGAATATVDDLVKDGYLTPPPVDPYGGRFYIDANGQVKSTSKFAFAGVNGTEKRR